MKLMLRFVVQRNIKTAKRRSLLLAKQVHTASEKSESFINCINGDWGYCWQDKDS